MARGRSTNTATSRGLPRRQLLAVLAGAGALAACSRTPGGGETPLPRERLVAASVIADKLARGERPVVLYIGPSPLFRKGRLPGARNVGEAGQSAGLAALRAELAGIPPAQDVVIYCGCCSVRVCPNVRPADAVIAASGRRNAWLLDLPTNLRTDWTDRGYPVEIG